MVPSKTMTCPKCGNVVAATDQFCPKCFARLEPPSLWRRILSLFQVKASSAPRRPRVTVKKTVNIRTTDKDGVQHEYHSLNEVPPELREEIKKLQSDAMKERGVCASSTETSSAGNAIWSRMSIRKNISVYKIKDAAGNERVYHSLDELPPEIRAVFEKNRSMTD
jgi:hypothetical protein